MTLTDSASLHSQLRHSQNFPSKPEWQMTICNVQKFCWDPKSNFGLFVLPVKSVRMLKITKSVWRIVHAYIPRWMNFTAYARNYPNLRQIVMSKKILESWKSILVIWWGSTHSGNFWELQNHIFQFESRTMRMRRLHAWSELCLGKKAWISGKYQSLCNTHFREQTDLKLPVSKDLDRYEASGQDFQTSVNISA